MLTAARALEPATAPKIVQGYISQLREVLADETSAGAAALRDEALGIARELGMGPLTERLLARRGASSYSKTSSGRSADTSG